VPSFAFGPFRSASMPVISADLSGVGADIGLRIDVIVGMDVLRHADFLIDYQAHVLRFGNLPQLPHRAHFENRERLATVPIAGLGKTVNVLLDTGFSQLLIFAGHVDQPGMHRAAVELSTGAGRENLKQVDSSSIEIGDCRFPSATLLIGENSRGMPGAFDGLLGVRFLRARQVAFDFTRQILSWK
jgi:hypothetical protein